MSEHDWSHLAADPPYVTISLDRWERIAAVVRATLPGADADVWDDRILKARDALTPEDIEAVQP